MHSRRSRSLANNRCGPVRQGAQRRNGGAAPRGGVLAMVHPTLALPLQAAGHPAAGDGETRGRVASPGAGSRFGQAGTRRPSPGRASTWAHPSTVGPCPARLTRRAAPRGVRTAPVTQPPASMEIPEFSVASRKRLRARRGRRKTLVILAATVSRRSFRLRGIGTMVAMGMVGGLGVFPLPEVRHHIGRADLGSLQTAVWVPMSLALPVALTVWLHQEDG